MAFLKARPGGPVAARTRRRSLASLIADLSAEAAECRRLAARELALHPDAAEAGQTLIASLANERDQTVQAALLGALTAIATPSAITALIGLLHCENVWLRNAAMAALQEIGPAATAGVCDLLQDPDPDLRIAALMTLGGLRDPVVPSRVIAVLLTDANVNVCSTAVEMLERIGGAEALPALRALAQRFPDEPFLAFAANAVCARLSGEEP